MDAHWIRIGPIMSKIPTNWLPRYITPLYERPKDPATVEILNIAPVVIPINGNGTATPPQQLAPNPNLHQLAIQLIDQLGDLNL